MSILQTIDLKKYYGTEPNITRALDGVNFSVEDGEFVAVVGTSGSGKSTLLHMMGGLDTPTSGNVIVRDKELSKMNRRTGCGRYPGPGSPEADGSPGCRTAAYRPVWGAAHTPSPGAP